MRKALERTAGALVASACVATMATGFSVTNDTVITGNDPPPIVGAQASAPGDNTITPSGSGPKNWTYQWGDRNGDGGNVPVATPGLALGAYKLYSNSDDTNDRTLTLNLNHASSGAGHITGDSGTTAISTDTEGGRQHHIVILNAGDIEMGVISSMGPPGSSSYSSSGNIAIGQPYGEGYGPVGNVTLDAIRTRTGSNSQYANAGNVTVHSSGHVLIWTRPDSTPGAIDARGHWRCSGGTVLIRHNGRLAAGTIDASGNDHGSPGSITLDGDYAGDGIGAGDTCRILALNTSHGKYLGGDKNAGAISIRNYAAVELGTVEARTANEAWGGTVAITNILRGIAIAGAIDLRNEHDPARSGELLLACGGRATNVLAALNLNKVRSVALSTARGVTAGDIAGSLTGFDTAGVGAGTWASPVLTTQTALRAPEEQQIRYAYEQGGVNDSLGGHVYRIADLDGNPHQGGFLMPEYKFPPRGTVALFR